MTNPSVTIYEGVHCQHCGKPAPPKATKRFQFCNDTCRQAAYRERTGKSAYAGTIRAKTPVPVKAEKGLPKDDPEWNRHELDLLRIAFRNHCRGGVIEVYHHNYGRGVLDVYRPFHDCKSFPSWFPVENRGFARLYGLDPQFPNMAVWDRPRCQFQSKKAWHFLEWRDVWLLDWHGLDCRCKLPSTLGWIHKDPTRRIRRSRMVHVNFSKVGVSYDSRYGSMVLTWQPPDPTTVQQVLNESTGGNNDAVYTREINLEHFDKADSDGGDGQNEC